MTVRVYRVEGTPNTRLLIGENGEVAIIDPHKTLYLNFGDKARRKRTSPKSSARTRSWGRSPGRSSRRSRFPSRSWMN